MIKTLPVGPLWELYRSYRTGTARMSSVEAEVIAAERDIVPLRIALQGQECFQAHGIRSAWIYAPWSDGEHEYPGYEYKGAGNFDGSHVYERQSGPHQIIVGGQRFDWAQEEYYTTHQLWHAGVSCQRPMALFRIHLDGIDTPAGLFVRTNRSPIRLIDFWRQPQLLHAYLELTGEDLSSYTRRIGATIAQSLPRMFGAGCAKPIEIDNTSSEGELLDFEHVWNG
jgi:hypothetical protein